MQRRYYPQYVRVSEYSNDDIALPIFFLRTFLRAAPAPRAGSSLPITRLRAATTTPPAWIAGCTGSLTDVALRYAGQENTALLSGKFEVIALNGTLEQSGEHLHLCVSDPHGTMLGGHMMPGCTVRTTLELVIGCLEELAFSRQSCALSGYDELHISPR